MACAAGAEWVSCNVVKAKIIAKRILFWGLLSLYAAMMGAVIAVLATHRYKFTDIKHVGTSSLIGLLVVLTPVFVRRVFRIEVSLAAMVFGYLMIVLNTLGEVFDLYYLLPDWDIALHTFGGYGFAFLVFGAFCSVRVPRGRMQTAIYLLGAVAISISISTLWELIEYAADKMFGTNMLKTIPENGLFNGGSTNKTLVGTDAEIAGFYRYPSGYMYAVTDTISDLVRCVIGAVLFCITYILVGRRHPARYKNVFTRIPSTDRTAE
jgi:hypothetical protein